jgi:hypothetical protein
MPRRSPHGPSNDLKIERIEKPERPPPAQAKTPTVPRSYAVIVGISSYANLGKDLQLQFAERDAQAIYTILISPEGGNFKAENVHMLTGAKATLADLRREIDAWLPTVGQGRRPRPDLLRRPWLRVRRQRLPGALRYRSQKHSSYRLPDE